MATYERKILYYLFLSSAIFAVIFAVFLLNLLRNYKRNQRLQKQVTAIEFDTLEKERLRIRTDLHDDVGPILAVTKNIASAITIHTQEDQLAIRTVQNNIDAIIDRLKSISFNLSPASLTSKGLIYSVHELIEQIQGATTTSLCFIDTPVPRLSAQTELHIYRIIKESLFNCIRHAHAEMCNVEFSIAGDQLTISIIDDGKGFTPPPPRKSGINNIALRTRLLHGRSFIDSAPGNGTRVTVQIPISLNNIE